MTKLIQVRVSDSEAEQIRSSQVPYRLLLLWGLERQKLNTANAERLKDLEVTISGFKSRLYELDRRVAQLELRPQK